MHLRAYLFVFLFSSLPVFSQGSAHITVKDGLPQSFIPSILQDDDGFMWIASRNGLMRFDGTDYKIFQSNNNDVNSLSSNIIANIYTGKDEDMWIEYQSKMIDVFNLKSHKIKYRFDEAFFRKHKMLLNFNRIFISSDKSCWFITDQMAYCYKTNGKLQGFKLLYNDGGDKLKGVYEDDNKILWLAAGSGIHKIIPESGRVTFFPIPQNYHFNGIGDRNPNKGLIQNKEHELMFGGDGKVIFFNPTTNQYRYQSLPALNGNQIHCMAKDPEGKIYFDAGSKLFCYNSKSLKEIPIAKTGEFQIRTLFVDRSGLLWLGTNISGIYQVNLLKNFEEYIYDDGFVEDVLRKELKISTEKLFGWTPSKEVLESGYYLHSRRKGEDLWIAFREWVLRYDLATGGVYRYPQLPEFQKRGKNKRNAFQHICGITISKNNSPLVLTLGYDIYMFNDKKKEWILLVDGKLLTKTLTFDCYPHDICFDGIHIWISTATRGLLSYNLQTKRINNYIKGGNSHLFPSNDLFSIEEDKNNKDILWIGSYQGLIRFNKKTHDTKNYTDRDGLPGNAVFNIVAGNAGNLWITTNKGLCRFSPQNNGGAFTAVQGLSRYEFARFHHLDLGKGNLAFGNNKGWILFNTEKGIEDHFDTPVAITSFKVNNDPLSTDNKLVPNVNAIKKITLQHDQNTINIRVASLEYNQPQDLAFRYYLEGYDSNWIIARNSSEAIYTKLPPGDYVLKINANNSSGIWSNRVKYIKIIILPPWWLTWWAKLGYLLLFCLIVLLVLRYRKRSEDRRREDARMAELAAREAELYELKKDFFSNITHELKTPLTLILGPAGQLIKNAKDDKERQLLAKILGNGNTLLNLVNKLLDLARLDAHAMKSEKRTGDLGFFIRNAVDAFSEAAKEKGIQLLYSGPASSVYSFSGEVLERILANLISNAIKFTQQGGEITVSMGLQDGGVMISVSDTGSGIAENEIPFIFDRYYQASTPHSHMGSGLGLSLVKELVDLEGGHISAINNPLTNNAPCGVTFSVYLPLERAELTLKEQESLQPLPAEQDLGKDLPVVLLVEDNPEMADFISGSLQGTFRIELAANGADGLAKAMGILPDLIISDVMMPVMDGRRMCKALSENDATNHIPVILLTARNTQEDKLTGLLAGAVDYLSKPFSTDELLAKIGNHIARQKYYREYLGRNLRKPEQLAKKGEVPEQALIFLDKIYAIVDQHLDDPLFGVEQLSDALFMSKATLYRKLKSVSGLKINEIIRNYRLGKAAGLLIQNSNIYEVAHKTGFGSQAYFTKCFREFYNETPSEYIKKNTM